MSAILLKGLPSIFDSDEFHVQIFPLFHPLLNLSLMMSIYLTILMTLDRYSAVIWQRKQGNPKKMKLSVTILFLVCSIYTIPKWMEYRRESRYTRVDYDLQEKEWTKEVIDKLHPKLQSGKLVWAVWSYCGKQVFFFRTALIHLRIICCNRRQLQLQH